MDLVGCQDVLAEGGEVDVGLYEGVEGVDALLGEGGGVGFLAVECHLQMTDGEGDRVDYVAGGGVHHHGGGGVGEGSGVDQVYLPPMAFFGGGAEDGEAKTERFGEGLEGESGAYCGRGR